MTTGVSIPAATTGSEGSTPPAPAPAPAAAVTPPAATPPVGNPPTAPVTATTGTGTTPPAPAPTGVSLSGSSPAPASGDQGQSPFAGLSDDHKKLAETKGWKSLDDVFASLAGPTDIAAYDAGITKPENAEKIGYNDDFAKWLKATSLKHGVPVHVAKAYHDEFVTWAGEQVAKTGADAGQAQAAAITEKVNKAGDALLNEWGQPNTPKFSRNLDMAMRAMNHLSPDLKGALMDVGVLVNVGGKEMVANATIMAALAKVGAQMYAEDSVYGSAAVDSNPFDPASIDLTKQGQIIRTDKAKAAQLIRALKPEHQQRYAQMLSQIGAA